MKVKGIHFLIIWRNRNTRHHRPSKVLRNEWSWWQPARELISPQHDSRMAGRMWPKWSLLHWKILPLAVRHEK